MGSVVFLEGFELYKDSGANTGLAGNGYSMGFASQDLLQPGRFGGQCLYINQGGGTEDTRKPIGSALTTFTVGFAFMQAAGGACNILELISTAAGQYMLSINTTVGGGIDIRRGSRSGTLLGASAGGFIVGAAWSYIEMSIVIHATAGTVDIDIDGINALHLTGQNTQNVVSAFDTINFCESSVGGGVTKYDDLYVRDDLTRFGPSRIETLQPVSDVAGSVWTPSTGANDYACVDELAANGDTDYITASTVGDETLFEFADLAGVAATVHAVGIRTNAEKTDGAARAIKHAIKVGATETYSADRALATAYAFQDSIFNTAPDGTAWDATKVAAIQAGVRISV